MIRPRTLFAAALLLPVACSEAVVHAHVEGEPLAACCAVPDDSADEADKLAALISESEAGSSSVEVVDITMSELLGESSAEPTIPADGTGLANLGKLPEFSLFDETGADFTRADMLGEVWVVDFIFTRCSGPCPDMSRAFTELQDDGVPAKFLSITVDPGYDSPQVLTEYRTNWGVEAERWKLLTGAHSAIQELGNEGFKLPINATEEPVEGMGPMFHSGKFALIDHLGRVRGYYRYDDKIVLAKLATDAAALAALLPG